ncbi:hypothetical protein RE428_48680 (plasmid) [Marinobacter nanhaiticus D15-8W]|uniref:DUF1845 domain-containing protein n=1 Tax=Marinobacter nanhaiticus D15-8W TaxID=626887 RepID=N6X7J7_9GAMM|nr:hypothetical protein [Marinobacter nanhaiticus]ENO17123.1 hypothetical protein J057_00619 [Marinobacter nanhaiticus D15-8W]BES73850.1 hypothetical protein RE428_48680 [Marinobacter nanhaiticus D15-8W]
MKDTKKYDAQIIVNDIYLIVLWDKDYFNKGINDPRVSGKRVAEGLFSIEAFASNKREEHKLSSALARKLRPEISKRISETENQLRVSLEALTKELNDPIVKAVNVSLEKSEQYPVTIEKGKGTPLVNSFIRLFVILNEITKALKELHFKGVVERSEYKKREKIYAKPLRRLMNDLNLIIKNYHKHRKS